MTTLTIGDTKPQTAVFPTGLFVATPGALHPFEADDHTNPPDAMITTLLYLHSHGIWTTEWMHQEDIEANHDAIRNGNRIMSVFKLRLGPDGDTSTTTFWMITEADRSVTTLLLPSEY